MLLFFLFLQESKRSKMHETAGEVVGQDRGALLPSALTNDDGAHQLRPFY